MLKISICTAGRYWNLLFTSETWSEIYRFEKKKNQKYKRLNENNTSLPVSLSTKPTLYIRESGWQNTLKQRTNKDRFLRAAARIRRDTCKKHKCPKKSLSENEHDLYAESKWNWHTSVTVCFAWISHAQIFLDAPNMLLLHLTARIKNS